MSSSLGTVNNVIGLQSTLMNEGLFSLPSQKEKLVNFRGFKTAIVVLEATVLDKVHSCPAHHERSGDHTNNEPHGLWENENNATCNSCTCRFSDLQWELMWCCQSDIQFLRCNNDTKPYSLTIPWLQFLSVQYSGLQLVGSGWGHEWCFQ